MRYSITIALEVRLVSLRTSKQQVKPHGQDLTLPHYDL